MTIILSTLYKSQRFDGKYFNQTRYFITNLSIFSDSTTRNFPDLLVIDATANKNLSIIYPYYMSDLNKVVVF
jgi:hypothetical protein